MGALHSEMGSTLSLAARVKASAEGVALSRPSLARAEREEDAAAREGRGGMGGDFLGGGGGGAGGGFGGLDDPTGFGGGGGGTRLGGMGPRAATSGVARYSRLAVTAGRRGAPSGLGSAGAYGAGLDEPMLGGYGGGSGAGTGDFGDPAGGYDDDAVFQAALAISAAEAAEAAGRVAAPDAQPAAGPPGVPSLSQGAALQPAARSEPPGPA